MRDLFTKDPGWKLFSLFLAAVIWLTVNRILHETGSSTRDTGIHTVTYDNQPVVAVSPTADVRAYRVLPATVKVTVAGPAAVMDTLQANDLHITVDLPEATLLSGRFLPVEISTPPNVSVTSIDPQKVLVIIPPPPEKKP